VERTVARGILGLPQDRPIVMFGAMGGTEDPRKGSDLLFAALGKLALSGLDADLLIVGEVAPQAPPDLGFPVHYLGHLSDDVALRLAYAAADAFVLPSRLDNLPNTGVEALASGRPVIGFDTGGLPDIITHETNGYLARAFDVDDLARGIGWVLGLGEGWKRVSVAARTHAEETFAGDRIAERYAALYASILGEAAT
jgi:glycosyltransferase involved in cell wall biosynthesis